MTFQKKALHKGSKGIFLVKVGNQTFLYNLGVLKGIDYPKSSDFPIMLYYA